MYILYLYFYIYLLIFCLTWGEVKGTWPQRPRGPRRRRRSTYPLPPLPIRPPIKPLIRPPSSPFLTLPLLIFNPIPSLSPLPLPSLCLLPLPSPLLSTLTPFPFLLTSTASTLLFPLPWSRPTLSLPLSLPPTLQFQQEEDLGCRHPIQPMLLMLLVLRMQQVMEMVGQWRTLLAPHTLLPLLGHLALMILLVCWRRLGLSNNFMKCRFVYHLYYKIICISLFIHTF